MKSIFKRFAIILGIVFITAFVLLIVISRVFEDQIGEKVISAVNEELKTELRMDAFELSILRSFPNLGANLKGVEIDGTDQQLLLRVDEISLRTSLFSLFTGTVEIKSVVIADGRIYIANDKKGKSNFDIVKESEETSEESSGGVIDLQHALLKNIEIDYQDEQLSNRILLYVDEASFSGAFGSKEFDLNSEANLNLALLKMDDERLMREQNITYDLSIHVNSEKGIYKFKNFDVQIGALPLHAKGELKQAGDAYDVDMSLESDGGQLSDLISLLPPEQKNLLGDIESRGEFSFQTDIKGQYAEHKMPEIIANIRFEGGRISGDRIKASIRDLSFLAEYTNGSRQNSASSRLKLSDFKGDFEGEAFEMNLSVENFDSPDIDLSANGQIAVGALMAFIPDERITDGEGMITIDHLKLQGQLNDMTRMSKVSRVHLSGDVGVEDASLTINGEDIELDKGHVVLEGNDVSIRELTLKAPGTDLVFNGKAVNLLPVIFADSTNSKSAEFVFEASLHASELDIDELLSFGTPSEEVIQKAEEEGKRDSLTQVEIGKRNYYAQFLNGTFSAKIDEFNYNKIEGQNFEGKLAFDAEKMKISGRTEAMSGSFELDAELLFTEKPSLEAKLSCNQIHADVFLEQADNFGQNVLVADNLEGQMDARFFIQCSWDEQGEFSDKDMHILGGVGIHDGVLKDFKMLEDFSSFVDIRDLREIRFKNLENFFEIKNSTLYLPVMFIQSNALNLTVSGQHTFEQDIAYFLKVNAGQVMTDKFRRHNSALRPKPAQRDGFFNLHYAILGNIDNYTFSSDKKRVQRDFEESELRKRDIHFALEKALGTIIELVEEPMDWRDIPEHKEDPNSTTPEFLDMDMEGGGGQ